MSQPTIDLHVLYRDRALRKARGFLSGGNGAAGANYNGIASGQSGAGSGTGAGSVSSSSLSKSPGGHGGGGSGTMASASAIRDEVNRRDHFGRTVLHLAASELGSWALEWVTLLLSVSQLNVNAPDGESGWSALHRALYAGNIAAARLILGRDDADARLKDHEGLTPFDVYNSTVDGTNPNLAGQPPVNAAPGRLDLYTWGSNKNFVLGFSGDGERVYPERVPLKREEGGKGLAVFEPLRVKDVSMARLHTCVVTDERRDNVRLCGYGTGGRLGRTTHTQFTFSRLLDFPHQASSVVTSPDHTVIVTTSGDVYTFGLNRFGQLGYALEQSAAPAPASRGGAGNDEPIQFSPRRVVGALKKEVVLGAAASRTHTVVFTADSLYTWGTNKGQLGYPPSGTPVQVLPRKVTTVSQPIVMLTATENATACLLETKEVVVLYHEGYIKVAFPLSPFPSKMQAYRPPQVGIKPSIAKIASCGNTFVALSSLGDVFSFSLDSASSTAIESPSALARLAPKPQRIWSLRRKFTAVTDVGVGLDGTIILCTVSGHVFVRSRRFDSKSATALGKMAAGSSNPISTSSGSSSGGSWKFSRVPFLQRVVKVAANSTGAFAALRADVPLRFIDIDGPTLAQNLLGILPHWRRVGPLGARVGSHNVAVSTSEDDEDDLAEREADAIIQRDIEVALRLLRVINKWEAPEWESPLAGSDAVLVAGGKRFPVHALVLASRSPVLAQQLQDGAAEIRLDKVSDLTALLLMHYLYSDDLPPIWDARVGMALQQQQALIGHDIATVKTELRQLAKDLSLPALADALAYQVKTVPAPSLSTHLSLLMDQPLEQVTSAALRPDIILELADRRVPCHSVVLRARCTFFETFYEDVDWTVARREEDEDGVVCVDLKHIGWDVMSLVLEHVYRDAGMSLFQAVERPTADEYIDFVTHVLAAANELLLDKLKQVCSAVLRSFVTLNNVCSILVDAAFYEAADLARACMYYLASSMETVLEGRLLDDLPPALVAALAAFCQERQGAKSPISRSGLLVQDLMIKHATWLSEQDVPRQTGGAKKWRPQIGNNSPRPSPSMLSPGPSPSLQPRRSPRLSPALSPSLRPVRESQDEPFAMDEDFSLDSPGKLGLSLGQVAANVNGSSPAAGSGKRRPSMPAMSSSPSAVSFTPLGSPPPPRLQPWMSTASSASKAPLNLRSIMASEAANAPRPKPTPLVESRPVISTPGIPSSSSGGSWRPVVSASKPSLASIQSEQQSIRTPVSSRAPAEVLPRPLPRQSSASPATTGAGPSPARISQPTGPLYTPTRAPSGSGSRTTPKGGFGGADIPWTNYTIAPTVSSSPALGSLSDGFGSPATAATSPPPSASFAAIQSQQRAEEAAIREVKAPRSFAEVMAREQAEARKREQDERQAIEAAEFDRWFELESQRVQGMLQAPEFVPQSASAAVPAGSLSSRGGGGHNARGGGGGGAAGSRGGRGRNGKKGGADKSGAEKSTVGGQSGTGQAKQVKSGRGGRGGGARGGGGGAAAAAAGRGSKPAAAST